MYKLIMVWDTGCEVGHGLTQGLHAAGMGTIDHGKSSTVQGFSSQYLPLYGYPCSEMDRLLIPSGPMNSSRI